MGSELSLVLYNLSMDVLEHDQLRNGILSQVGLITSQHSSGRRNIMAAEWTYQVSYSPGLFVVCIGAGKTTLENIFVDAHIGISFAAEDQGWVASLAGGSHGKAVDKVSALQELGVQFREHADTGAWTVMDSAAELILCVKTLTPTGDHTMVVGETVWAHSTSRQPLAYHQGKYWSLRGPLHKPAPERLEEIETSIKSHTITG